VRGTDALARHRQRACRALRPRLHSPVARSSLSTSLASQTCRVRVHAGRADHRHRQLRPVPRAADDSDPRRARACDRAALALGSVTGGGGGAPQRYSRREWPERQNGRGNSHDNAQRVSVRPTTVGVDGASSQAHHIARASVQASAAGRAFGRHGAVRGVGRVDAGRSGGRVSILSFGMPSPRACPSRPTDHIHRLALY
jgi:hypothetical protein